MKQVCILCFTVLVSFCAQAQVICTIAGSSSYGYSGDGGAATAAGLNYPIGLCVDSNLNIYFADHGNNCIRKVSNTGIITTVAGNGSAGFSGDGGAATDAELSTPYDVAIDGNGDLYIADLDNIRIRKVTTSGIISTFAGNGSAGYSGDGGPATAAKLNQPQGLAIDHYGNLYVAEWGNGCIRMITRSGVISTVAGIGGHFGYTGDGGPATAAKFELISDVAVDSSGNIYITDHDACCVRKVNTSGTISTIAGTGTSGYSGDGGPATAAKFMTPYSITVDDSGNIFVGDTYAQCVRKINRSGIISTITGNDTGGFRGDCGPASRAELYYPRGVATDKMANIYVVDEVNDRIRMIFNAPVAGTLFGRDSVCPGATITLFDTTGTWGGIWTIRDSSLATVAADTGIVTGIMPGVDTISYTKYYNCGSVSASYVITVVPDPVSGAISGIADTVCPGQTITFTDTTTGGNWVSANTAIATISRSGVVTGVSGGSDLISYSVTNYCGTIAATRLVTVEPGPSAGIIGGPEAICQGDTATITHTEPGGSWFCSNTATVTVDSNGTVIALMPGNDTIIYVVSGICGSDTVMLPIIVNSSALCHVGIAVINSTTYNHLLVYPNPAEDDITINYTVSQDELALFEIIDMVGKIVASGELRNNSTSIKIGGLSTGNYIVKVKCEGKPLQTAVIVKE